MALTEVAIASMGNKNTSAKIIDQKTTNNHHKTFHVPAKWAYGIDFGVIFFIEYGWDWIYAIPNLWANVTHSPIKKRKQYILCYWCYCWDPFCIYTINTPFDDVSIKYLFAAALARTMKINKVSNCNTLTGSVIQYHPIAVSEKNEPNWNSPVGNFKLMSMIIVAWSWWFLI